MICPTRLTCSNGQARAPSWADFFFFHSAQISGIIPAGIAEDETVRRTVKENFFEFANEREVAANFRPIRRKSAARMRSMAGSQLPGGGHLCPSFDIFLLFHKDRAANASLSTTLINGFRPFSLLLLPKKVLIVPRCVINDGC